MVTVVASDGAKTTTRGVTVTVEDVDETGTVTLSSLQPMVDIDLTATLSDPDGRLTNIEWQWEFQDGGTWEDISGANSASSVPARRTWVTGYRSASSTPTTTETSL